MKPSGSKKSFALIIILLLIITGTIAAYFIFQKPSLSQSLGPPEQSSNNEKSLFGTMVAYNINDATAGAPGETNALQKGWTEFRKDNSAYQNLLSSLKKLIQGRTKLVKETGFSLDRGSFSYFTWNVIEPQKGQFDWALPDLYVKGASGAGVKISAVVQPFAGWDQKNTQVNAHCKMLDAAYYDYKAGPPNDLTEYENFLTKTVERYKDTVAVWEIGNEPDAECSGYQNNPRGYFDLLKISSEIIKRVDPEAKVTNGGASGHSDNSSERSFWTTFFQLGGGQYIDYFNIHYNDERSSNPTLDSAAFQRDLTFWNGLMDKSAPGVGGRKPLYLTEFGIYSGSPSDQLAGQLLQGPGQSQTNSPAQPTNGKCGDGICDAFEKQNSNACPQDCGGGRVPGTNPGQLSGQPTQGQAPSAGSGQALRNVSENEQAVLYFKNSILAFGSGAKTVFIDLIGPNGNLVGSSMAFNTDGKPRLLLTTLKMIDNKVGNFTKVEKIADGQYKFSVNEKTIYTLWAGILPNEISGKVKVTDIKGRERLMDATGIQLSADQPVCLELRK